MLGGHQGWSLVSPRLPRVTANELLGALYKDGWYKTRQTGSHVILHHTSKPGRAVVPVHSGVTLPPAIVSHTLSDVGLTPDELRELLK
jgi:predicted RNA binding protein YcfA (HicA-like mRNA interferase family)